MASSGERSSSRKASGEKSKRKSKGKKPDLDMLIYEAMESSREIKDCCRALSTQALHAPDVNRYARCIRSCLEMGEVADLLLFVLSNSSPNTKSAIRFAIDVVTTCEKECSVHKGDEYCKMSCQLCATNFKRYKAILRALLRSIPGSK